jgi:hypothetical protein
MCPGRLVICADGSVEATRLLPHQGQGGGAQRLGCLRVSPSRQPRASQLVEQEDAKAIVPRVRERAEVGSGANRYGRACGELRDLGDLRRADLGGAGPCRRLGAHGDFAPVEEECEGAIGGRVGSSGVAQAAVDLVHAAGEDGDGSLVLGALKVALGDDAWVDAVPGDKLLAARDALGAEGEVRARSSRPPDALNLIQGIAQLRLEYLNDIKLHALQKKFKLRPPNPGYIERENKFEVLRFHYAIN